MLAINLTVIALFYKEFKISAFDPALAMSVGINATPDALPLDGFGRADDGGVV